MITRIFLWLLFVINTIGIAFYLIACATNNIKPPDYFMYALAFYGIFTTMAFGELVLKHRESGNNKRV